MRDSTPDKTIILSQEITLRPTHKADHRRRVTKGDSSWVLSLLIATALGSSAVYFFAPHLYPFKSWDACAISYQNKLVSPSDNKTVNKRRRAPLQEYRGDRFSRGCIIKSEPQCQSGKLTCSIPNFLVEKEYISQSSFEECVHSGQCVQRPADQSCPSRRTNKEALAQQEDACLTLESAREVCSWSALAIPSYSAWFLMRETYDSDKDLTFYSRDVDAGHLLEWIDLSPFQSARVGIFISQPESLSSSSLSLPIIQKQEIKVFPLVNNELKEHVARVKCLRPN